MMMAVFEAYLLVSADCNSCINLATFAHLGDSFFSPIDDDHLSKIAQMSSWVGVLVG
jgi:hypothetical protein